MLFSRIAADGLKSDGLYVTVIRRFSSFVEFEMAYENEKTKVQLAYDSPFRFEEPVDSELGIKINDYKGIIVDKFLAFFGRSEPRDAGRDQHKGIKSAIFPNHYRGLGKSETEIAPVRNFYWNEKRSYQF